SGLFCLLTLLIPTCSLIASAGDKDESLVSTAPQIWRTALVIKPVGKAGRTATHTDAIEAAIINDRWTRPTAGEAVALPDGHSVNWTEMALGTNGWFESE